MTAPVFVLSARALNVDSRKLVTYLGRLILVFLVAFFLLIATFSPSRVGAPGLQFFEFVVWLTLLCISAAGVFLFSSVITEEKEEMMLGLLKMTGLNPLSIILGKSSSHILGGVLLLLAPFPFTLLAITLGGVALGQVIAAYCTMLSYLLFLGGLALFCSVCTRRTERPWDWPSCHFWRSFWCPCWAGWR